MSNVQTTVLRCPGCGANAAPDSTECAFCHARLATMSCAKCVSPMFLGMKHCPRCGAAAARDIRGLSGLNCPRCKSAMTAVGVGSLDLAECDLCDGAWLETEGLDDMIRSQEAQSAVVAWNAVAHHPEGKRKLEVVRYCPCPRCQKMMNRMNFARVSGVIIDVCSEHGTWFDREELGRVAKFIQDGGLAKSRRVELENLREEHRQLRMKQNQGPSGGQHLTRGTGDGIETGGFLVGLLQLFS